MNKRLSLFCSIFLLSLIVVLSGCGQSPVASSSTSSGTLSGKILDKDGNPVPSTTVTLRASTSVSTTSIKTMADESTTTASDGTFSFSGVADGTYSVECDKSDDYKVIKTKISVGKGATVDLGTLSLAKTGAIAGQATFMDKTSHLGIDVFIPGTSFTAKTDATGAYSILYIPPGIFDVYAMFSGYNTTNVDSIEVKSNQATTVEAMALIPVAGGATSSVKFVVKDSEDSTLIENATVAIGGVSQKTDSSGATTLNPVFVGKQYYTVTKSGYKDYAGIADVVGGTAITVNVPFIPSIAIPAGLSASASAAGQITLNWTANSETDIVGYDVYRSNTSASGFVKINASTVTTTTYIDSGLLDQTYYYKILAKGSVYQSRYCSVVSCLGDSTYSGRTWTQATSSAAFSARQGHGSVMFNNKIWIIGGNGASGYLNDVWYSSDGVTWTQATADAGFSARCWLSSVVFDNKIWVIGGYPSSGMTNDVWYSSDGVTWTQATAHAGFSGRAYHTSVVFNNKMWVIGGYSDKNDVWYSSDGVTWTQATANAGFSGRSGHTSMVFDNKMWVIGGEVSGADVNDVWYSTDGITWTQATAHAGFGERFFHSSVVFNNKMWVIGGISNVSSPTYKNDVWYSNDGTTWTQTTSSAGFSGRYFQGNVVFNNKMWVIDGSNGPRIHDVWWSN